MADKPIIRVGPWLSSIGIPIYIPQPERNDLTEYTTPINCANNFDDNWGFAATVIYGGTAQFDGDDEPYKAIATPVPAGGGAENYRVEFGIDNLDPDPYSAIAVMKFSYIAAQPFTLSIAYNAYAEVYHFAPPDYDPSASVGVSFQTPPGTIGDTSHDQQYNTDATFVRASVNGTRELIFPASERPATVRIGIEAKAYGNYLPYTKIDLVINGIRKNA